MITAVGYKAAEYLINLGHRNIAYITLEKNVKATVLRTQAMMDACYKHGITPRTEYIIEGKNYSEGNIACQTALNLLNRQKRPTAIICGNDEIALQVYGAAAQAGLSIPEKLSFIGFDDFRAISENIRTKTDDCPASLLRTGAVCGKSRVCRTAGPTWHAILRKKTECAGSYRYCRPGGGGLYRVAENPHEFR
ncbi:hypothetical protein CHS0354_002094 [Potamilus streckersoni]|uniref:Transcriptional regulator LacI/GalR-like sensor domain-containing protein n=1 Tax=Potamilus streckersoni TaxID=2493646 RepID=A0AAE0T624_9BIVA|nr:hypothetical protein CHS0354_002094 [Potamilus streckersoni]